MFARTGEITGPWVAPFDCQKTRPSFQHACLQPLADQAQQPGRPSGVPRTASLLELLTTTPYYLGGAGFCPRSGKARRAGPMHGIIYLVGLIVVVLAILSFFGLR